MGGTFQTVQVNGGGNDQSDPGVEVREWCRWLPTSVINTRGCFFRRIWISSIQKEYRSRRPTSTSGKALFLGSMAVPLTCSQHWRLPSFQARQQHADQHE